MQIQICAFTKFAEGPKLGAAAESPEGEDGLQRDLDGLEDWAMINGMKFNKLKCWILHHGWRKTGHKYKSEEEWLESSPAERDLGVLAGSRLSRSQQCALTAWRANHMLGCMRRRVASWTKVEVVLL